MITPNLIEWYVKFYQAVDCDLGVRPYINSNDGYSIEESEKGIVFENAKFKITVPYNNVAFIRRYKINKPKKA